MKVLLTILGVVNGGYMLLDGIYVSIAGKYMGPEKPGPWANIFHNLGINVFRLGPLFITMGLLWLVWSFALWTSQSWAYFFGIILSILTFWYLPIGTVISFTTLIILLFAKEKTGL